ncbi:MAG: hypothetical protein WCP14_02155 [bacterium]
MQKESIRKLLESYRNGLITADELIVLLEKTFYRSTSTADQSSTLQQD